MENLLKNSRKLRITENLNEATHITHSGVFHADEVFATALCGLEKIYNGERGEIVVYRTNRVDEEMANGRLVYDIGGGQYDHHQKGGNGQRGDGIPYSSFGLLWKRPETKKIFDFLHSEEDTNFAMKFVDENLVKHIDAIDNGYIKPNTFSVSAMIASFNPGWDQAINSNETFEEAVYYAYQVLDNIIQNAVSVVRAKKVVELSRQEGEDKRILNLNVYCPWQEYVNEGGAFVVFPSLRGGFMVQAVPTTVGGMDQKVPFPEEWAGLRDKELQEKSGVNDAVFCHNGRFIASAETRNGALELAKKALELSAK